MMVRPTRLPRIHRVLVLVAILAVSGTSAIVAQGTPATPEQDYAATARALNEAFNDRDWNAAIALMSSDVELVMVPTGQVFRGHDEARAYLDVWANAFSDARIDTTLVVADDSAAAMEFIGRGTHDGPLESPTGAIPPTGQPVELFFTQFIEFEDGKIARSRLYYDLASLMRQIETGATPESIAAQEAPSAAVGFVTPDPADCTVEPRSMESLFAFTGTPPVTIPLAPATPGLQVPDGEPADPATVDAVTATIHEFTACENAGDQRRVFALVTDTILWEFEAQRPLTEEEKVAAFGATPVPLPSADVISYRVTDVQVLSGGEVIAVVEKRASWGSVTLVRGLLQDGDRYLINRTVDAVSGPPGGTPAA